MKDEKNRKIIQKEEKMGERRFSTKNRFVSFLLAIAMVLTLLPIGAVQAKAEEATVKLYFELPDGTTVADWGVNVWSNAKVTEGNFDQVIDPWGSKMPKLQRKDIKKHILILQWKNGIQVLKKQ